MKIREVTIEGIGGINNITLNLDPELNIICGPNGIGKSTILEAISFVFNRFSNNKIKKNIVSETGRVTLSIFNGEEKFSLTSLVKSSEPKDNEYSPHKGIDPKKMIKFDTKRHFEYQKLATLNADSVRSEHDINAQIMNGVIITDIKEWLAKRHLFSKVDDGYSKNTLKNVELAKKSISSLNENYFFSRVNPKTYDIFVKTPNGEIWYEYLSSGFKSCISLLIGLIKEIEIRFSEEDDLAVDFNGLILIDELELHLHPEWQSRITEVLTMTFPKAQFIVSTHSPHVVQNAKPNQIITLERSDDGHTQVRESLGVTTGYTGWTIDEVLRDVMGMESTLSRKLQQKLNEFYDLIDSEDYVKASEAYSYLDKILHPRNVLRKSLSMSLDLIKDSAEDA